MEITSRNSMFLRTDISYNVAHHSYIINDAITLMKVAVEHLESDISMGIASAETKAKLEALKTAINYASL